MYEKSQAQTHEWHQESMRRGRSRPRRSRGAGPTLCAVVALKETSPVAAHGIGVGFVLCSHWGQCSCGRSPSEAEAESFLGQWVRRKCDRLEG